MSSCWVGNGEFAGYFSDHGAGRRRRQAVDVSAAGARRERFLVSTVMRSPGRTVRSAIRAKAMVMAVIRPMLPFRSNDEQGTERTGERAQQPVLDDEHGQVHERQQGLHVLEARLGAGVVEHREAAEMDFYAGKRGAYVVGQAPGVGRHLRHLGDAFSGQVQRHVDAGRVRRRGNEAVDQQGLVQGDLPGFLQDLGRLRGGIGHQVGHKQVIALGGGVLEAGDQVDTDGKGDLPRLLRQALNGRQRLGGKDLAGGRRQDEQGAVVLAVDVLRFLEGLVFSVRNSAGGVIRICGRNLIKLTSGCQFPVQDMLRPSTGDRPQRS